MPATKATGSRATKARSTTKKAAKRAGSEVRGWEDDPGAPEAGLKPISRPAPQLGSGPLPVAVAVHGRAPAAKLYSPGTAEFRYWAAGEALRRAADFWSSTAPGLSWFSTVGDRLEAQLDVGEEFNAYYDRYGLRFFHGQADGKVVYSGESPDVVCHELGHAVLDALRPQLFDTAFIECGAFHESFGDMSAMLSALQLSPVRQEVLVETGGNLNRSSRLSRLAEQLGWAIRLVAPDAVDADCLRNAKNSFFYQPPENLPPDAPASALSSEPHSFSRVFTAAFLECLAGMFAVQSTQDEAALAQTAGDAARLLVEARTAVSGGKRFRAAFCYWGHARRPLLLQPGRRSHGRGRHRPVRRSLRRRPQGGLHPARHPVDGVGRPGLDRPTASAAKGHGSGGRGCRGRSGA
jgi:hypothetical protein